MDASTEALPVVSAPSEDAAPSTAAAEAAPATKPSTESGAQTPISNSIPLSLSAGADPWADPVATIPDEAPRPAASGNPWSNDDDAGGFAGPSTALSPGLNAATSALSVEDYGLVKLGHEARKYWAFKEGYTNLNNGSFGACPRPVLEAFKALNDKAEETPDHFRLRQAKPLYAEARSRLAAVLNCSSDDVVLIPNSTTATNAVLRDIPFGKGDGILLLSVGYGAVERTVAYVADTAAAHGVEVKSVVVPIALPLTDEALLEQLQKAIAKAKQEGTRIKVGIVDAITSMPAAVLPWEKVCKLFKEEGILSLIDGAHAIGQIPIDIKAADPDFFVSNCHKWLYAHRGCAVFYTAKRNQVLQRSSLPTSWSYLASAKLTAETSTWQAQWEFNGTTDLSSVLSVPAALDFIDKMGGLSRVMSYNRDLARRGGLAAAKVLGTELLDVDGSSSACMVNVRIPVAPTRLGESTAWFAPHGAVAWMFDALHAEFKTAIPIVVHEQKLYARFSAQLWLEVADFEYGARALRELARRINTGEVDFSTGVAVERSSAASAPEAAPQEEGEGDWRE